MQTQQLQPSGEQVEHLLHEFVDQPSQERVVEGSGVGGDPSVEVPEKFVRAEGLALLELFDPQSDHFSDILKSFLDLTHLIQRLPLGAVGVALHHQPRSLPILHSQILSNCHCIHRQILHRHLDAVIAVDARIDYFSCESGGFVGGGELAVEIVPPSYLVPRVEKSPQLDVGYHVEQLSAPGKVAQRDLGVRRPHYQLFQGFVAASDVDYSF